MQSSLVLLGFISLAACEGGQVMRRQVDVHSTKGSGNEGISTEDRQTNSLDPRSKGEVYSGASENSELGSSAASIKTIATSPPANDRLPTRPPVVAIEPPDSAYIPISVGGAFLTCSVPNSDAAQALCSAKNSAGNPLDFHPQKAYFITNSVLTWTPVDFYKAATIGSWYVKLPYKIKAKSFAIGFADTSLQVMLDWVVDSADMPPLKLVDGSFEDISITTNGSGYVYPAKQTAWHALDNSGRGCKNILELGRHNPAAEFPVFGVDGSQWIELDSACDDLGTLNGGSNPVVSQLLTLKKGNFYEISFSFHYRYRTNVADRKSQSFQFKFGDEVVLTQAVAQVNEWYFYKVVKKATTDNPLISFQELGEPDGGGSLIDNVVIHDAGTGPK